MSGTLLSQTPKTEERNLQLISSKSLNLLRNTPKNKKFVAPGYKRTSEGKQVLELRFDNVAGCLRTPQGGSSRQTLVIHNNGELHSRLLTIRETARLMGALILIKFQELYNDGYKAMGDGVADAGGSLAGYKITLAFTRGLS